MKVRISSPLQSYTKGLTSIELLGSTLADVINELDKKFPGIKFRFIDEQDRIRPHMRIFVDGQIISDLNMVIQKNANVYIVHLISGG